MQEDLSHLETLKNLSIQKRVDEIKTYLENLPKEQKGNTFEDYLKLLLEGNGWVVKKVGGRNDAGGDLLLSHPKEPEKTNLIVQAKNWNGPLTYDDTRIELIKFEEKAESKYDCSFFEIFSLNGYVLEA